MSVMYGDVNWDTATILAANGCEVVVSQHQTCCGALHLHNGFNDEGKALARTFIDSFGSIDGLDAIVINSAGCGSTLKEYGKILEDDPVYADRAQIMAGKCKDVTEFLDSLGWIALLNSLPIIATYHDACHLAQAQRITDPPRRLLAKIPDLSLVPLPESEVCCGSAGIYNLTEPEMARRLQQRKVDCVVSTGASVVVTGNPGMHGLDRSRLEGAADRSAASGDTAQEGTMLGSECHELSEVLTRLADQEAVVREMARAIGDAFDNGNKVLTCGNGGSAAEAAHLAEEFTGRFHRERKSLPAICLSIDGTLLTCIGNDYGFEEVFARQISSLGKPGDVLVVLSSSGNSENINRALRAGGERGMTTISLSGKTGGICKGCADLELIVPSDTGARVQECQLLIVHTLCEMVERRVLSLPD